MMTSPNPRYNACTIIKSSAGFMYHPGELETQARAGVASQAAELLGMVGESIRDNGVRLLEDQGTRELFVTGVDPYGAVWVTALYGPPGWIQIQPPPSRDPQEVTTLTLRPDLGTEDGLVSYKGDPFLSCITEGAHIAILALRPETARRYRVNGQLCSASSGPELRIGVAEAYGNCPKYIQKRVPVSWEQRTPPVVRRGARLTERQRRTVSTADTFVLGTYYGEGGAGADCSHRGGAPGFVQADASGTFLEWPDYPGNNMMQSMGNLAVQARCGLLFVDRERGDMLHITGRGLLLWGATGAQRRVRVQIEQVVEARGASPLRYRLVSYSPYNFPVQAPTGVTAPAIASPNNSHVLVLSAVREEARSIKTFQWRREDGQAPLDYVAGQYAVLEFDPAKLGAAADEPVLRCFTITSLPDANKSFLEITVKLEPAGLVTPYLHGRIALGARVCLREIAGNFALQSQGWLPARADSGDSLQARRVLLVSGGIGITPMLANLRALQAAGGSSPAVTFLHSTRAVEDVPSLAYLNELSQMWNGFRPVVCVTGSAALPAAAIQEHKGVEFRWGRMSAKTIATYAPQAAESAVLLCGSEPFMDAASKLLIAAGVPSRSILTESFDF